MEVSGGTQFGSRAAAQRNGHLGPAGEEVEYGSPEARPSTVRRPLKEQPIAKDYMICFLRFGPFDLAGKVV